MFLRADESRVLAVERHQFFVIADLRHAAFLHDRDAVAGAYGTPKVINI